MARQKKRSMQQLHNIQYWRDHDWSSPVSQKFPEVRAISIEITTRPELSWMGEIKTEQHHFGQSQKAFFRFRCRYHDCVAGGITLCDKVSSLIAKGESELSGVEYCRGWQDEGRINRHHCLLQHDYRISVQYQ